MVGLDEAEYVQRKINVAYLEGVRDTLAAIMGMNLRGKAEKISLKEFFDIIEPHWGDIDLFIHAEKQKLWPLSELCDGLRKVEEKAEVMAKQEKPKHAKESLPKIEKASSLTV